MYSRQPCTCAYDGHLSQISFYSFSELTMRGPCVPNKVHHLLVTR